MTEQDEQRGDPEIGVCHICGRTFDTQLALSLHLMDAHEDDVLSTDPAEESTAPTERNDVKRAIVAQPRFM